MQDPGLGIKIPHVMQSDQTKIKINKKILKRNKKQRRTEHRPHPKPRPSQGLLLTECSSLSKILLRVQPSAPHRQATSPDPDPAQLPALRASSSQELPDPYLPAFWDLMSAER